MARHRALHPPSSRQAHFPIRCRKECFPAPKAASPQDLVSKWSIFCTGSRSASNPVQKRVFSCTKNHPRPKMVHKWGIFCTGSRSESNSVQKRVFFCTKIAFPQDSVHRWSIPCTRTQGGRYISLGSLESGRHRKQFIKQPLIHTQYTPHLLN